MCSSAPHSQCVSISGLLIVSLLVCFVSLSRQCWAASPSRRPKAFRLFDDYWRYFDFSAFRHSKFDFVSDTLYPNKSQRFQFANMLAKARKRQQKRIIKVTQRKIAGVDRFEYVFLAFCHFSLRFHFVSLCVCGEVNGLPRSSTRKRRFYSGDRNLLGHCLVCTSTIFCFCEL